MIALVLMPNPHGSIIARNSGLTKLFPHFAQNERRYAARPCLSRIMGAKPAKPLVPKVILYWLKFRLILTRVARKFNQAVTMSQPVGSAT